MAPAKKNLKATKKFEKKHLKGVLDKRKAVAKIKQRHQLRDKKARRAKDAEFHKGAADGEPKKPSKAAEMSVDDFFRGGFDDLVGAERASSPAGKPRKRKRKRGQDADASDDDSSASAPEQPVVSDIDDGDGDGNSDGDSDLGMNKEAMDALADKDPDFFKFLQENDPEALDFDDGADLAGVDELSAGDQDSDLDEPHKKRRRQAKAAGAEPEQDDNRLSRATVASWRKAMAEKHSLRAARQVVLAFRCAARLSESDGGGDDKRRPRWTIDSPDVFNDVVVLALKEIPVVMNHHLPVKESAAGRAYVQMETKKFKTLSLLLKSFASSVMLLLGALSDDKTLKLTLSSLTPVLPYLLSFKKLVRALTRAVVDLWAQPGSSESTRVTAFLVLRRLVVIGDKGIREAVLKTTYQGLVQGCRVTNHATAPGINLMKNSAAELWGLDPAVGYTTAFALIRQLAVHLRGSIVRNANESFRAVYNWQFTHSLDFWSCVLAEHCSPVREAEAGRESPLRLLIYPLVQVTLGTVRLLPSALYLPLRFHLVRALLRTSRATGTYIPLASPLLEVLASAEMRRPPRPSTLKALDFAVAYKAPCAYLRTRVYQDGVGDQAVELLGEYMFLWATSVAFPELALPVVVQLKRWLKQARSRSRGNANARLAARLAALAHKLEANARFVEERRAAVDFAPRDRAQVDAFLRGFDVAKTPLGAYVVAQRRASADRARLLDEARLDDERRPRAEGRTGPELDGDEASESDEVGPNEESDEES